MNKCLLSIRAVCYSSQLFLVALNSLNGAVITRSLLAALLGSSFITMTDCLDWTGMQMLPMAKSLLPVVLHLLRARYSSDRDDAWAYPAHRQPLSPANISEHLLAG